MARLWGARSWRRIALCRLIYWRRRVGEGGERAMGGVCIGISGDRIDVTA